MADATRWAALRPKQLRGDPGLGSLYPYYAGFSQDFVRDLLSEHHLLPEAVVLDPWNGSGTTTAVVQRIGRQACGVDLNPFATIVARAKLTTQAEARTASAVAEAVALRASQETHSCSAHDPLLAWLPPAAASMGRALIDLLWGENDPSPLHSLLIVALARACRRLTVTQPSSNPTWIIPRRAPRLPRRRLLDEWFVDVQTCADVLSNDPAAATGPDCNIITGDARALPLHSHTIDLVISSPPYCTRIDYAVKTRLELDLIGASPGSAGFRALRRTLMGTTAMRPVEERGSLVPLSRGVTEMLDQIGTHPSQGAAGYYLPWLLQYYTDATAALGEICRVLKPGGYAYLVLQNSFFKSIHIDLPSQYLEIAKHLGMSGSIVSRFEIERHRNKATVNRGAQRYVGEQARSYYEALLQLRAAPATNWQGADGGGMRP